MMNSNTSDGKSTSAAVYRLLKNPTPICMFYFAHPFGIASPASGAKLAQIRDRATKGCRPDHPAKGPATVKCNGHANGDPKQRKVNGTDVAGEKIPPKSHRKTNGPCTDDGGGSKKRPKKHRTRRRISNFERFLLDIRQPHTCTGGSSRIRRIDRDPDRLTPLVPWPSIIWNRDFLIPTLLQALAQQHGGQILSPEETALHPVSVEKLGRKIPDIEQILRTVRSAWNTPNSQRSHLQSQDSRESSASNWDLSSLCDSCCLNPGHRKMGAGTYANATSPGPGLLRRRYSVPEIIMRKHTLAQQKTDDEPVWLHHDTNHNVIEVVVNKHPSATRRLTTRHGGPGTPVHRKSFGLRHHHRDQPGSSGRSSSVESGPGTGGDWMAMASRGAGSDPNLATLKHRNVATARCGSPLCNGFASTRAAATGTGGSLRSIPNNSLSCSSSSSVNGPLASGGVGGVGVGEGGHHVVPFFRDGDYSMRKTTLLRRMWSRELRRYERSGSWSPPLRRGPRRIYSVESVVEGHRSSSRADDAADAPKVGSRAGRPDSSGSGSGSSVGSGRCVTTATTTTTTTGTTETTGTTSCLECAKLERQYNGDFGTGQSLAARTRSHEKDLTVGSGSVPGSPAHPEPATVDDRRQRRRRRMCSSQSADLDASESVVVLAATSVAPTPPVHDGVPVAQEPEPDDGEDDGEQYPSRSSSLSSVASQSYRVPSGAGVRQDNEGDLGEFLRQERLAAGGTSDGHGDGRAAGREVGAVRPGGAAAGDHPRERAAAAGDSAGTAAEAVEPAVEPRSECESESDSGSGEEDEASDLEQGAPATVNGGDAERTRLDEYISGLLLDNLNNLADATELVQDGGTLLGVYSERRAQLDPVADRANNNDEQPEVAPMKQKLTEKYFGDGGGVVCNSPPQPEKRRPSVGECDKENVEDAVNNNGPGAGPDRAGGHRRTKPLHRAKGGNGFYLRSGSRSPRAAEVDLNGKYYFPAYGLETDPSDNTDIASEPEAALVLGKIGTGSTYDRGSAVVPRFSAMPRTESMEVQPSSSNSAEDDPEDGVGRRNDEDNDDDEEDVDDSDASSLVDSLDGFGPPEAVVTPVRVRKARPGKADPPGESTTSSTDRKSPRPEKGEAFFVPIHAETTAALRIDERVVVADTMPLRIKERLNNRRRLMNWKKEQESLKKQRKMMRMIEQKRFYGEPAIQVISTIDRAISRKEFIPAGAKKAVFGGGGGGARPELPETPSGPVPFRAMKPKKRAAGPAAAGTGSALRSELGMLESYKIDGKGNMQIQTAARKSAPGVPAATAASSSSAKSPWGLAADRRQGKARPDPTPSTGSSRGGGAGRGPAGKHPPAAGDGTRRRQVLKDVQQMTLYPPADLTPDIEGGPRRVYQKTEIQEGDKHIEILEIVECADSAPRSNRPNRPVRVHSGGRRPGGATAGRSRIPVPIYRFGHFRRSHSRDGSPLSGGGNPKVDRMIADLLLEALTNPEEVGVKLVRTPDSLRGDMSRSSAKRPSGAKKASPGTGGTSAGSSNTLQTPRRTASGRYTQKFEMIPEERSSVSIESSTEELSPGGRGGRRKGPHPSPRRVSFDENHQILNRDELDASPTTLAVPSPSPKRQPATAGSSPAKSPTRGPKKQGTATVMTTNTGNSNSNTNTNTTTTSRGKAAIESDVIEEKGWIGFSTQHEDMATPVHNAPDDEAASPHIVPSDALEQPLSNSCRPSHVGRSVVRTITTGNCVPEVVGPHPRRVPVPDQPNVVSNPVPSVGDGPDDDHNDDDDDADVDHRTECRLYSSTAESFVTDSLNTKLTPATGPSLPSLPSTGVRCCGPVVEGRHHPPDPSDVVSYQAHQLHRMPAGPFQHQIREENAWQVFQAGDCKVIQSKIEYYETSIHRTPLTGGELCHAPALSTADSLDGSGSWHRHRTTSYGDGPPKTSETTCSSCCFCNPDLHHPKLTTVDSSPGGGCFYCRAKLGQSPTRSFPAPPTPPNIQTSPVPPSPQTPIAELTPTPSLQEIALPVRKSSLPKAPGKANVDVANRPTMAEAKKADSVKGRPVKQTSSEGDKTSRRSTTTSGDGGVPQKPLPPIPVAPSGGLTPRMGRKKPPTDSAGVLNRPKHTNHLTRATTVVQSVQKETKNELRAPIRVLPKTAKEVNNRKEKDRQIGLSLPKEYDGRVAVAPEEVVVTATSTAVTTVGSAGTHGYDNETSSTDGSGDSSTPDSSPNGSPFKAALKSTAAMGMATATATTATTPPSMQPPTAASRWKTNSERNLSHLAIQKLVSASRWGSKWRKGATKGAPVGPPEDEEVLGSCSDLSPLKAAGGVVGSTAGTTTTAATSNIISGISQTSSNQGWTVTVAGNYNPDMAPDVEMRLSFPKGAAGSGKSAVTSSAATSSLQPSSDRGSGSFNPTSNMVGRPRQGQPYGDGMGDHFDVGSYPGGSRSTSRAGTLPPPPQLPGTLNPKRNLTRSDGTGAGGTGKDYRLPNVGPPHNIPARPTARKAIKTVECSVVASATRTIANNYHQLSHQHQMAQEQQHFPSRGPPMTTGRGGGRTRAPNQLLPQPSAQVLHPALQNGSGGKFLSSSSPSLVSQQQQQQLQHHPSQRYQHPESTPYHLEDYGAYYGQHNQQPHGTRRMSLDSQQQQHQQQPPVDCLSIMGNAIAPELKPRVPTMSEKDLTRRHHVCYTRTQPYFS